MSLDIGGTGPVTAMGPDFVQYASGSVPAGSGSVARMYAATGSGGEITLYFKQSDGTEIDLANAGTLAIAGDTGSGTTNLQSETLTFTGGTGVDTSVSGDTVTFVLDLNELSSLGAAPAAADQLALVDATDSSTKKVTITNLAALMAGTVTSTGISDSSGVLTLDIQNMTAATTVADGDLVVIDDGAGGTLRKMTRAQFIESAALDAINIDGGAIDGTPIGASSAAAGTFTTLTANTSVLPDSSGGADLGSATAEWGDVYVADDKAVKFGSDQDAAISYDESGSDVLLLSGSASGLHVSGTMAPSADSLYDLGSSALQWKDVHADAGYIDAMTVTGTSTLTTVDINGGAIDGTTLGASSQSSVKATTMSASSTLTVDGASQLNGAVTAKSSVTAGTSFIIGSADLNETDMEKLDGITDGTAAANKALVLDASKDVSGVNALGIASMASNWTNASRTVADMGTVTTMDLNGGSIDGAVIGAASAAAGTFTTLAAGGDVDLGDATSDTITATGRFDSDLVPSTDSARDLGTSALQWAEVHADAGYIDAMTVTGTSTLTTVDINGGAIDGVTIGTNSAATRGVFTTLTASYFEVTNDLTVSGNLNVVGNINSIEQTVTTLEVVDKLIIAASGASSANTDGGGLQLGGYDGTDNVASVLYDHTNAALDFNIGGTTEVRLADGAFLPEADSDVDLGSSTLQWKDIHADAGYIDAMTVTGTSTLSTVDINAGAIDGTVIGANSRAAASVTTMDANSTLNVDGASTLAALTMDGALINSSTSNLQGAVDCDSTLNVDGAATFNANVTLGDAAADIITSTGFLSASADVQVNDDKTLYFGTDKDAGIKYDEAGANGLVISGSSGAGILAVGDLYPAYDSMHDLGTSTRQWAELHCDAGYVDALTVTGTSTLTTVDINGGNIDGTIVGASSVAAGSFAALVGTTATFSSTLTANGDVDLGNATSDTITATARFDSALTPSTDSAQDLGTSALQWANVYADKIGCHTAGALTVSGSAGVAISGGANSNGYALELADDADTGKARAYAWATYSSARLKKNIETLENPMDKIMQMRGVSYEWKAGGHQDVGFIAEEMGQVFPEVVHFGNDGRAQSIDYSRLTSVLVEAVKELKSEIEVLKNNK